MDDKRFDRLARAMAGGASRRRLLAGLAGAVLAAIGVGHRRATADTLYGDWTGRFCGGFAGIRCPDGFDCVDDAGDSCDPAAGGADCAGVCQPVELPSGCAAILCPADSVCCEVCGEVGCYPAQLGCPAARCPSPPPAGCAAILCQEGTVCCESCGQGTCLPADQPCPVDDCGGEVCNQTVCGPGEFCCNWSCSTCAPYGGGCTEQFCGGEPCGDTFCAAGEYCCNPSCGICAPIGGACITIACVG